MSEQESVDYYLRFAEVTEQLVETLSDTLPDIPSQNHSLDEEMQKALWVTQTLIRRWREAAVIDTDLPSSASHGDDQRTSETTPSLEVKARFARK